MQGPRPLNGPDGPDQSCINSPAPKGTSIFHLRSSDADGTEPTIPDQQPVKSMVSIEPTQSAQSDHAPTTNLSAKPSLASGYLVKKNPAIPKSLVFLNSPIIILHVGGPQSPSSLVYPEPIILHLHSTLLKEISPFFCAALGNRHPHNHSLRPVNLKSDLHIAVAGHQGDAIGAKGENTTTEGGGFAESQNGVIYLPEERPEDWLYLVQWLYGRAAEKMMEQAAVTTDNAGSGSISSPTSQATTLPTVDRPRGSGSDEKKEGHAATEAGANCHLFSSSSSKTSLEDHRSPSTQIQSRTILTKPVNHFQHPSIDPPLKAHRAYLRSKRENLPKSTASLTPDACKSSLPNRPPPPPAFGPLIRLYLLADRFDLRAGLRHEIARRVWEVAFAMPDHHIQGDEPQNSDLQPGGQTKKSTPRRRGASSSSAKPVPPPATPPHFLPNAADIRRLWNGVPFEDPRAPHDIDLAGGYGTTCGDQDHGVLKSVILDLFSRVKGTGVFFDRGLDNSSGAKGERGDEGAYEAVFLRDLVVRLLEMRKGERRFRARREWI